MENIIIKRKPIKKNPVNEILQNFTWKPCPNLDLVLIAGTNFGETSTIKIGETLYGMGAVEAGKRNEEIYFSRDSFIRTDGSWNPYINPRATAILRREGFERFFDTIESAGDVMEIARFLEKFYEGKRNYGKSPITSWDREQKDFRHNEILFDYLNLSKE